MSIFSSRTVKTLPIPFDAPHEVTIRKLSGAHLDKAHDVWTTDLYLGVKARGGSVVQKDVQKLFEKPDAKTDAEVAAVAKDPLNGLDLYEVMAAGIVSWTYPESLKREPIEAIDPFGNKVTVLRILALDDLDAEARDFFAREIMRLTKPALFEDTEAAKATQKETDADSSIA